MPGFLFYDHSQNQSTNNYKGSGILVKARRQKVIIVVAKFKYRIFQRLKKNDCRC